MDARVISNYRLTRQIGIGGMGVVYLGEHTVIDRKVAIKLLRPEYSGNEELVQRFFNEARAAATSKHPGIVEILDVGFDQGQAFIMMEYIDGETLSKYVRSRGRLNQADSVVFASQIATALGVAHQQTIVHRDLKPSNVMVVIDADTGEASTKVFDFGIAKLFDENSSHTRTGVVIGTPLYMSPEQCKGAGQVDHRSDLYSLGCILYFMLTGKRVFSGQGDGEIIAQHIFIEPKPPSLLAPVCEQLCNIVLRLLAKEPAARYQSTGELVVALDEMMVFFNTEESEPTSILDPGTGTISPRSLLPLPASRTSPGTHPSITGTPMRPIYTQENIPAPVPFLQVDGGTPVSPTLMGRVARKGKWIAGGFAVAVLAVVFVVSSSSTPVSLPNADPQNDSADALSDSRETIEQADAGPPADAMPVVIPNVVHPDAATILDTPLDAKPTPEKQPKPPPKKARRPKKPRQVKDPTSDTTRPNTLNPFK